MDKEKRTNSDRRKFNYTAYFPERRSRQERRTISVDNFKKKVA